MHIEFILPLKLILTKKLKCLVFAYTIDFYSQIYCSIWYKSHIARSKHMFINEDKLYITIWFYRVLLYTTQILKWYKSFLRSIESTIIGPLGLHSTCLGLGRSWCFKNLALNEITLKHVFIGGSNIYVTNWFCTNFKMV
jgi:hypothetical protein